MRTRWVLLMIAAGLAALTVNLVAQVRKPAEKVLDVRFGQRTVLVADPNQKRITLTPGSEAGDLWVCVPYGTAQRSCRTFGQVMVWILEDAPGLAPGVAPAH